MSEPHQTLMRDFRASDLQSVQALIFKTIDVSYAPVYPPRALSFFKAFHSEADILQRHRAGDILVIELEGKPIATGTLVEGEIFAVFVDPDHQQHGLGKTLMRELETRALAQGYEFSELSVSLPSRRFYEGLGYELLADRSKDLGNGQQMKYWQARKSLRREG